MQLQLIFDHEYMDIFIYIYIMHSKQIARLIHFQVCLKLKLTRLSNNHHLSLVI